MQIIKLPEPELRERELSVEEVPYRTDAPRYLTIPRDLPAANFFAVLERRRTSRLFGRVDDASLAFLLWTVAKTRLTSREPSGYLWQHRSSPSAGGRHPVDLLVIPPPKENAQAFLYDPIGHALHEVATNEAIVHSFHRQLQNVVGTGDGTVIWLVAHYNRSLAKYKSPESLVWRDAGVLMGTICFAAEALELNCCPYGLIGDAWVSKLFGDDLIGGAGGCVVGSR